MKHLEKKLSEKKKESSMEQGSNDNAEEVKEEVKEQKRKGRVFLFWTVIVIYSVLAIYLLFDQLTEFVVMLDSSIRYNILKSLFR